MNENKGLAKNRVGLFGAIVIGISCIAPTYTLTSGIGPAISVAGKHVPAILLLGFIPMLLVAIAYRELNSRVPDSGTSFTWATKSFGPWVGWMGGWGLISATVLVLSNLAAVAVDFFFLLIAQLAGKPEIADLTRNLWVNIPTTIVFVAVAAYVSYRGLESTQYLQTILVGIQLIAIVAFDSVAIYKAYNGQGFDFTPIELNWFNPLSIDDFGLVAAGISLSIFMFWGWDVTLTMNEETRDPEKTPGRAATGSVIIIIALYVLTALAIVSWGGIGSGEFSAGNPDNQESVFATLSAPVLGPFAILIYISVLCSSFASLQSTMVSPARTLLAMGYYKALPPAFSKISPKYKTPSTATLLAAVVSAVFYAITRVISENALWDTISALGLMICFYYGMTAIACIWYFRSELMTSVRGFFYRLVFPAIGGGFLLVMFFVTAVDSMNPEYGSGNSVFGVGTVFVLGMGILVTGVVLLLFTRIFHPDFFLGKTLPRINSVDDQSEVYM
nr:APC family permease [Corynebacterium lactis]